MKRQARLRQAQAAQQDQAEKIPRCLSLSRTPLSTFLQPPLIRAIIAVVSSQKKRLELIPVIGAFLLDSDKEITRSTIRV